MKLVSLELEPIRIPFRQTVTHNAASRAVTESVLVTAVASSGERGFGEGCPRAYVSGEDLKTVASFFQRHRATLLANISGVASLKQWANAHRGEVDANPAAWCAIEVALLDVLGKTEACSIEELLGLPSLCGCFRYSAVLGDSSMATFRATFQRYRSLGFSDFKLKLSGHLARDRAKLTCISSSERLSVRADANNLWRTLAEARDYLLALDYPLTGIEEPLRAGRYEELRLLANATAIPQILDESLLRVDQLGKLEGDPGQWVINVRVSKMGGILRAMDVVTQARHRGFKIIVGAQVGETSILTRAALPVARQAGAGLLAQEGAFGSHLLESDPCEPTLMFGPAGIVDIKTAGLAPASGMGLARCRAKALSLRP